MRGATVLGVARPRSGADRRRAPGGERAANIGFRKMGDWGEQAEAPRRCGEVNYSDPFGLCPIEKDGVPCAVAWGAAGTVIGGVGGAVVGGVGGTLVVPGVGTVAGAEGVGAAGGLLGGFVGSTLGAARDAISAIQILHSDGEEKKPTPGEVADAVINSGASVKPHPTKTGEGAAIDFHDGTVIDVRVENHPPYGPHGNVQRWEHGKEVENKHVLPNQQ